MGRKQNTPKPADAQTTQTSQTQKGAPEKNAKQDANVRPTSGKGAAKEKNKGANKKGNRR
jgi:hypothetical protein